MRFITSGWRLLGVVLIGVLVFAGTGLVRAVRAGGAGHEHTVFSAQLPNVPGKTLTAVVVEYAPGGSSAPHRHAARVYRPGETFFEPPGSTHLVGANASDTEPASLLAVFVADDRAQLTLSPGLIE